MCRRSNDPLDPGNASGMIWANRGYRSNKNEALLRERMLVSRIHNRSRRTGRCLFAPPQPTPGNRRFGPT